MPLTGDSLDSDVVFKWTVVIVNWNGWEDTIECLQSLQCSAFQMFRVVVVDNASTDGSVERIESWARSSSVPHSRLTVEQLLDDNSAWLTVVAAPRNGGFAYGNNIGMTFSLARESCEYIWLLNPDTTVQEDCFSILDERMSRSDRPGICGTDILFYHHQGIVQALNGSEFGFWSGNSSGIGAGHKYADALKQLTVSQIEQRTDFVTGASLALSRPFVEEIGMMDDLFFLFYEEIDLAVRNQNRFRIGYARGAIVFHKEGGSIGSSSQKGARSLTAEKYLLESKVLFFRKHFASRLPFVFATIFAQLMLRLIRGDTAKFFLMLDSVRASRKTKKADLT